MKSYLAVLMLSSICALFTFTIGAGQEIPLESSKARKYSIDKQALNSYGADSIVVYMYLLDESPTTSVNSIIDVYMQFTNKIVKITPHISEADIVVSELYIKALIDSNNYKQLMKELTITSGHLHKPVYKNANPEL